MAGEAALVLVRFLELSTASSEFLGDFLGTLVEQDLVGTGMRVAVDPGQVFVQLRAGPFRVGRDIAVAGAARTGCGSNERPRGRSFRADRSRRRDFDRPRAQGAPQAEAG